MKVSLVVLLSLPASAQVVSERFLEGPNSIGSFGSAIVALGDLDGDGVGDVAIGQPDKVVGNLQTGSVHICFLAQDLSLRSRVQIAAGQAGFTGTLHVSDDFGFSLANLGDRDGDGSPELAVGAPGDDDAASGAGAVWVLHLLPNGTVASHHKITTGQGGFTSPLTVQDRFGFALGAGQDIDGDGHEDLVASAVPSDFSDESVFVLALDAGANVLSETVITASSLGLSFWAVPQDEFGTSVALLGDVDGNGAGDVVIGVPGGGLTPGENLPGAVILFRDATGGVAGLRLLRESTPFGTSALPIGSSLTALGDLDGNGVPDMVGTGPSPASTQVFLVFLDASGSPLRIDSFGAGSGGFESSLSLDEGFGLAVAFADLDEDGRGDFVVGSPLWNAGRGRAWFLRGSPPPFVHAVPSVHPALVPGTAATLTLEGEGYGPQSTVTIDGVAVAPSRIVVESGKRLRVDLPQLSTLGEHEVSVAPSGGSAPGFDVIDTVAPATPALQIGNGNIGAPFANMVFSNEGLTVTVAGLPGQAHWVLFSDTQLPSVVPGLVSLAIGNAFTSLDLAVVLSIPAAGWIQTTISVPNVTAFWNFQSVTLDVGRPIPVSNLQQALVIPL